MRGRVSLEAAAPAESLLDEKQEELEAMRSVVKYARKPSGHAPVFALGLSPWVSSYGV